MAIMREDRIKRGKQKRYVNSNVKEFDVETYGEINLFGESIEECMPEKFPHIVQLGNLRVNRTHFGNPQQFRVYSPKGECPTLNCCFAPMILINDGEYKIRKLSGFECMRLMGVEDEDIQKLVDGGLSNNQLAQLAGNSIVVDAMSEFFKELIKH